MRLNIGSGCANEKSVFSKDWTNVDIHAFEQGEDWSKASYLNFDLTRHWPIKAETVDCIFASHIIEHIPYDLLEDVADECFRVLKLDAPIRIICPDPRKFITNWEAKNKQFILDCFGEENWNKWDYGRHPQIAYTDMFFPYHYAHSLCSSIDMIKIFFIRAGFTKVTEMAYCNTEFPQYFGTVDNTIDNRPVMSWYLECVKGQRQ